MIEGENMKGPCESGCGANVQVSGCKWCPNCYSNFSMGGDFGEVAFVVNAGKYEEFNGEQIENIKYSSAPMLLKDAEAKLKEFSGYPFARIEYVGQDS